MPPLRTDRRPSSGSDSDDPRRDDRRRARLSRRDDELVELEYAEAIGNTVDEAIRNALEILNADADEVEVEILEKGHRGFLGLGRSTPFRVRVSWREDLDDEVIEEEIPDAESPAAAVTMPAPSAAPERVVPPPLPPAPRGPVVRAGAALDVAAETRQLLENMGFDASVEVASQGADMWVRIRVADEEDEFLLHGRRGETRAALQQLLQRIVAPRTEAGPSIFVDINGRWAHRLDDLRTEALELARRALEESRPFRTRPLPSEERRVVHRALADMSGIRTQSEGDGREKRVVISPAQAPEIE